MNQDVIDRINSAGIPNALKAALKDLGQKVDALLPHLPGNQHRITFLIGRVIEEAANVDADTHWWKVALDLITKAADGHSQAGQAVVEAARSTGPLLRQHLGSDDQVSLQEITAQTGMGICWLSDTLTEPKSNYVAPNVMSLAQAHFNEYAWFRAIYAGKAPVGFVMIVDNDKDEEYFLWRFMIAETYHGRGYGRQAIERLVEYVKTRPGAKELLVSCGQGEGSPEGFYLKCGFEHTGEKLGHEVVLRLALE